MAVTITVYPVPRCLQARLPTPCFFFFSMSPRFLTLQPRLGGQVPSIYDGNDDPSTPLLSPAFIKSADEGPWRHRHGSWTRKHRLPLVLAVLGIMATGSVLAFLCRERISSVVAALSGLPDHSVESLEGTGESEWEILQAPSEDPDEPKWDILDASPDDPGPDDPDDPAELAQFSVDAFLARQSKTLEQAIARYTLKTRRAPPPNYDQWFQFAQERSCLIDEYDQIHRDFEPFYQMAREDAGHFREMVDRGEAVITENAVEIAVVEIKDGEVSIDAGPEVAYSGNWAITLGRSSSYLPDMTFLLNSRDEPRVVFNVQADQALEQAFHPEDPTPFEIAPHSTAEFFKHHSGCVIPEKVAGFAPSVNNDTAFLISSAKSGFTTDLYPLLSMAKISPCFSDILFPTEYYYDQSWWSGNFEYPDNIPWEDKLPQIYWRGMSNGGQIVGGNFHAFPRFKLIDLGRAHPDIMDVAITRFAETLCLEGCDRAAVVTEYNITGEAEAREDMYQFKYALDVDGTTFSGRYLGLLRSGSLVFKATVFEEYFNDWLRPYEHYVPVLPDLSDLVEKIEWANAHPEEARLIQQRGMQVAMRVVTDDQNDCYFFAVLLEWARLQEYARTGGLEGGD
ncbi:glycosyl transferase family 90-domain-containing protein [Mycena vulgaris]|nr:glycosyl transferase family 90-domain-containing protein [Mycena vulgaris]